MEAMELVRTRYSASKLGEPPPSVEALEAMLEAAARVVSAGCAAHGLMLGAFAQGLGAFWRTGEAAYDEAVKAALGIGADDLIPGFIYIGTDLGVAPSRPRPTVQDFTRRWTGDSRTRSTS